MLIVEKEMSFPRFLPSLMVVFKQESSCTVMLGHIFHFNFHLQLSLFWGKKHFNQFLYEGQVTL